ncbi:hypothetical protein [Streptomyces sp. NPDC054940]
MKRSEGQWVREHVWPPSWLRHYDFLPGPFVNCACHKPPSVPCQRGDHHACQHDGHPVRETVIQTSTGRAAHFPEQYEHRASAGRSGRRDVYGTNNLAWVWLAGAPCREICACVCHRPHAPMPPPAVAPVQLGLFLTN